MPLRERVREVVISTGKRSGDSDHDMEDGQPSAVNTGQPSTLPASSVCAAVSPHHHPCSGSSCTAIHDDSEQSRLRSEYLQVFTGCAPHQTGHSSRPVLISENGPGMDRSKLNTGVTNIGCDENDTDRSASSSCRLVENTVGCSGFPHSLKKNSTNCDSHMPSADLTRERKVDHVSDTTDERKDELSNRSLEPPGSHKAETQSCRAQPADDLPVHSSKSLADRIDGARQCCSAMRSDITDLSARCDALFSQLKAISTQLASSPFRGKSVTAGTVTSASLSVGVRQTSCVTSSSVPSVLPCSSVISPSRPGLKHNGLAAASGSRTSLNIIERVEEELSLRLDELTAYASSSEIQAEQTKENRNATAHMEFDEAKQHCRTLVKPVPCSEICEQGSSSMHMSIKKDSNRMTREEKFLTCASAMLTPPFSDESSSQNEDELAGQERSKTQALKRALTSWAGRADFTPTTPVLYAQSFGSDCHTPAIEALTCLESFSESGTLKVSLPIADQQSLQSSAMIHTPPLSDHSAGSEDHTSGREDIRNVQASNLTQPDELNAYQLMTCHDSEESLSSSDCSDSDWMDYYTDNHWTCPPPPLGIHEVSTDNEIDDAVKENSLGMNCVREKESAESSNDSEMKTAKNGRDVAAENGSQFPECKPMSETKVGSGFQQTLAYNRVYPSGGQNLNVQKCEPDEALNPVNLVSQQLQESPVTMCMELPDSHPETVRNITENYSTERKKNSATDKESNQKTGAATQTHSSERTNVTTDDPGHSSTTQGLSVEMSDIAPCEQTPRGVTRRMSSVARANNTQQYASSVSLTEHKPLCDLEPDHEQHRQHGSSRHLQSVLQTKCWFSSQFGGNVNRNSNNAKNVVVQSYNALEGVSCGFNFLRQLPNRDCPPLTDINNNLYIPMNIILPERGCFQTSHRETPQAKGLLNDSASPNSTPAQGSVLNHQSKTTVHSRQRMSIQHYISASHDSRQNRKHTVNLEELQTRMYMVTKVKSTEVGICVNECTAGPGSVETYSQDCFPDTLVLQDKKRSKNIGDALITKTELGEQSVALIMDRHLLRQYSALSEVTYSITNARKQHTLSCIVEIENERSEEESISSPEDREEPQNSQTQEHAVKSTGCPESIQSGMSMVEVRTEEISPSNRPVLESEETSMVAQETSTTGAGQKRGLEQDSSSHSQECASVQDKNRDKQDKLSIDLSFDNHFGVMNVSAPAPVKINCDVLTSTPVVPSQKATRQKDGGVMHAFFDPNQSVEQSCILEVPENTQVTNYSSWTHPYFHEGQTMHRDTNKAKVKAGKVECIDYNPDSSNMEIDGTPVKTKTKVFTNSDKGLSHSDIQSNLLQTFNAVDTLFTTKGHSGQTQHCKDSMKSSHTLYIPKTFVIVPHQSVPGPCTSEPHEMVTVCSALSSEGEEKAFRKTKTTDKARDEENEDLHKTFGGQNAAPDSKDLLLMKPRPKPLLPTPPYRRSVLSGTIPPCPHCLNHMLPPAPMFPADQCPAVPWVPCPPTCGCVHGDRCLQTLFNHGFHARQKPAEVYDSCGRAYNGPAASCVHHRGTSQTLHPPQSVPTPFDSRQRAWDLSTPQSRRQERCGVTTVNTARTTAEARLQPEEPTIQERLPSQLGKSQTETRPQTHKVIVAKADASTLLAQSSVTSRFPPQRTAAQTDLNAREDVLPMLMLTWTLLLWSLSVVVHEADTHRPDDGQ